jgi:hypothetical protein
LLDYYYLQHYIKSQHLLQQNSPSYLRAVRIRQFTVGTARLVGLLIFVAIVYTGFRQTITKPLSLAPAHILTLEEVYEDFNKLTEQELITENEFATTSSLRFSAWTRYSHSARDKNGDYFTLSGNVYIANNVTAAQQMIKAILTSPVEITGKVSEYTHLPQNPGFDELFLSGNLLDNGGQLIVRHGTYVYEIFFIGDGKLVLEALYRKVNQLL